jgi:hypothetical protein
MYCVSSTMLRMRLTVGVCHSLRLTVRLILSTVRLIQYDMLPQHQVNVRKLISQRFKNVTLARNSVAP